MRYDFPKIEAWLAGGEEILITKHSRPIGKFSPSTAPSAPEMPPMPDFVARAEKTWNGRFFTQEEVEEMRAFETGEP